MGNKNQKRPLHSSSLRFHQKSDTKMLIVILCLIFFYPVGIVLVWLWMKQWSKSVKLLLSIPILIPLVSLGFAVYNVVSLQNRMSTITSQYNQKQSTGITPLSTPIVKNIPVDSNSIQYACKKTSGGSKWDIYSCSSFSFMLPTGWMFQDGEFTNYDSSSAQGRDYSPLLDKGKLKFGIRLINSTLSLPTFVEKLIQEHNDKLLSLTLLTINNNSAMKTSTSTQYSPMQPITTIYIQNPSHTTIAIVTFIFGFDNNPTLEDQIPSTIQFAK